MTDREADPEKVSGVTTIMEWGKKLRQIARHARYYSGNRYNAERPSRRVEGEFGEEENGPALVNFCLMIDCSESMGGDKIISITKDIEMMIRSFKTPPMNGLIGEQCVFNVVYWADGVLGINTIRRKAELAKIVADKCPAPGGAADFSSLTEWIKDKRVIRDDIFVFFTDGEMKTSESDKEFCRKYRNKILWVLTPDAGRQSIDTILNIDPTANAGNANRIFWEEKLNTIKRREHMKIKATPKPNNSISTIKEWEKNVRKTHWKAGRSARTLAEFVMSPGAAGQTGKRMEKILEGICNSVKELDGTVFDEAYPEFRVQFDSFTGPRVHDLGILGATEKGGSVFAGIEAKVDEEFGGTVGEEYAKALKEKINRMMDNKNSFKADRIVGLVNKYFSSKDIEPYANLRYQLLHGLAGTVEHKTISYPEPAYFLFLIIVFKTSNFTGKDNYDENKGSKNYKDYKEFLKALKAKKVNTNKIPLSYVKDNKIYKIPIRDKLVYSAYVEIDAENGKPEFSYLEAGKKVTL